MRSQRHHLTLAAVALAATLLAPPAHAADSTALASLMPAYDRARGALSDDRLGVLAQPGRDLRQGIAALGDSLTAESAGVPAEKLGDIKALLPALRRAADALVSASSLPAARDAFSDLSKALIAWRRLAGAGPDIAYCPMANRYWLQAPATPIENPYGGRPLAGCGDRLAS